jgi:hypothetical protein
MPVSFGFAKSNNTKTKRKLIPSAIPTDGLQVYLDAGNPNSYPGAGNTWFDLSGNNRHSTLYYDVTHDKNSAAGALKFTTGWTGDRLTSSYISTQVPNLSTSNYTVIAASRYTDRTNDRGRIVSGNGNNWLMGHIGGAVNSYFCEGWVNNTAAASNDIMWRIYTATGDYSGDSWGLYVNNSQVALNNGGVNGPNGLVLGKGGSGSNGSTNEPSKGEIAFLLVWNRVLTEAERTAVYDYFKNRFVVQDSSLKLHLDASRSDSYSGSGTTWSDLSPSGNNVTLNTTPTYSDGKLTFAESTYGTVANGSSIIANSPYTKSVWVKFNNLNGFKNLISGNDSSSHAFWAPAAWEGRTNKVLAGHNGTWTLIQSSQTVETQKWYNLTLTFSTTNGLNLYINGQLEATNSAATTNFNHSGGPLYIGAYAVLNNGFNGQLASALVYNKELSASEVAQNYNASKAQFYTEQFPASVSGLQMWLKADSGVVDANGNSITLDNTAVDVWTDQSTNKKNARQSTAGSRPLYRTNVVNGLPAIQFDGTDDQMLLDGLATPDRNFSYFAVVKPTKVAAAGHNSRFMGSKISGGTGINFGCTTTQFWAVLRDNAGTGPDITWGTSQAFSDTILSSVIMGSSDTKLRVNRNQIGTSSRTSWSGTGASSEYIGSDGVNTASSFGGYICEILVFNRELTNRELNQVEQYLAAKWGISKAVTKDNEGLVAHWDAGNASSYSGSGTTWNDLTGNGNHATFANTPAHIPDSGGYFNFTQSTSQRATVSTLTNMPIGDSSVTIEAWIKHGGVANSAIVGWGNYGSFAQCQGLRADASSITWYNWGYDTGTGNVLTAGQWHHIVAKYDANTRTKQIWVDGVLANSTMASGPLNIAASNFTIGKAYSTQYAQGGIASLKIYNRPISSEEIVIKYNETKARFASFTPSNQGMSLWLRADSGVLDASGNQISSHNTTIATWRDKSGSGYDATQATDANRPLWYNAANGQNNLPAIYCDGTNRWLERREYLFTTAVTYFVVCKWADTTGRYWPFDAGGYYPYHFAVEQHNSLNRVGLFTTENSWVTSLTPTAGAQMFAVTANAVSGATININTDVTFRRNKTTHTLSSNGQNGSTWRNYADASGKGFSVGRPTTLNALQMKGQIYEIIVYNRVLSASERASVEDYLAAKWNIT